MNASFDKAAVNYDQTFTHSEIGRMQRDLVYAELSRHLGSIQNILEINCGTGEDAIWLAKQNRKVTATDISPKMIEIAKSKGHFNNLSFKTVAIDSVVENFKNESFDMVFSNFGGLNCLRKSELNNFFGHIDSLLSEKGKLALVIMPKNTLWEQFYFLAKAQFKNMSRRKKESVLVNVDGENVTTYYYNPKDIVNLAKANFETISIKPIGFFVPPSYLEGFFKNKKGILRLLNQMEKAISNATSLSKYADHYIVILQKR